MLRNSRRINALLTTGIVAVTAAACGGTNLSSGGQAADESPSGGPVTLGVMVDQTSYLKTVDTGVLKGIRSAVEAVNEGGGVLGGRQLEIVVADMAADPQREVQAYQRLATQDDPVLFLNGFSSAGNAAAAPLAASDERPMIVASVVPEDDPEWIFSTIMPMKYETGTRVNYLEEKGVGKVGILHDPTPYNELQLSVISDQLKDAGIEIVGTEEHASDAVDLRSEVTNLIRDNAEAVIKLSTGPTQIIAAKALENADPGVPLLIGIEAHENIVQATTAHPETYVVASQLQVFDALKEDQRTEAATKFMQANPNVEDPTYLGRGWDAVQLATRAIEEAGSTEGAEVRESLLEMGPYPGTSGTYDYTEEDHYGVTENPAYLARITRDGAEIVYTPEG
jgi:branched-chain amino acid transport system substrate-binding protein